MEERRTAVWVLGILALIIWLVIHFWPNPYKGTQTIAYKSCKINFTYNNGKFDPTIYSVNQNKLALCLCERYQKKHDTLIANKIIEIQKEFDGGGDYRDYTIDSLLKHKAAVFDTVIVYED